MLVVITPLSYFLVFLFADLLVTVLFFTAKHPTELSCLGLVLQLCLLNVETFICVSQGHSTGKNFLSH